MVEHKWTTEEVNGGPMGTDDFWKCEECGAGGGPINWRDQAPSKWIFLPDGSGLELTQDCDESKRLIAAYRLGVDRNKPAPRAWLSFIQRAVRYLTS